MTSKNAQNSAGPGTIMGLHPPHFFVSYSLNPFFFQFTCPLLLPTPTPPARAQIPLFIPFTHNLLLDLAIPFEKLSFTPRFY